MSSLDDITPEQAKRLQEFALDWGRYWKAALNSMWSAGTDDQEKDGHLLRQIRNQKGPVWLRTLTLAHPPTLP